MYLFEQKSKVQKEEMEAYWHRGKSNERNRYEVHGHTGYQHITQTHRWLNKRRRLQNKSGSPLSADCQRNCQVFSDSHQHVPVVEQVVRPPTIFNQEKKVNFKSEAVVIY